MPKRSWRLGKYLGDKLYLLVLILLFPGHFWPLFLLDFSQGLCVSPSSNHEMLLSSLKGVFRPSGLLPLGMASVARAKEAEKMVPPYGGTSNGEGVNKEVRSGAKTSARGSGEVGPLLETRDGQTRHLI